MTDPETHPRVRVEEHEFAELARVAWRALRRLGVKEEALSDAAQDALLVLHRRREEFRGESSLHTWLYGIVLRVASEYRRKARQRDTAIEFSETALDEQLQSAEPSPFETLERRKASELLHTLLEQLPDSLRSTFVLVELEELPLPEAARVLEVPLTTCKSRLRTARRMFDASVARERARLRSKGEWT